MSDRPTYEGLGPSDVEALLLAAKDYVGPSDDLRPRVLEEARRRRADGRRRSHVSLAAVAATFFCVAIGLQGVSFSNAVAEASSSSRVARLVATDEAGKGRIGVKAFCWTLVDAVIQVRVEQAEAFENAGEGSVGEVAAGEGATEASTDDFAAQTEAAGGSL